jgi:hypothetical protein
MEKRTREGGKVNYELPEYLASKVIYIQCICCTINNLFSRHPSESGDLRKEEPRLAKLAEETKRYYYNGKYSTCT